MRYDYEYCREGTCNLCMFLQPLRGWRHINVTARRTAQDFAHGRQDWVEHPFPKAQVMTVVLDNLNPQTPAALDDTFAPAEARRLRCKLTLRDTPKHGSWVNMAAIECAVVAKQCLDQRLPDQIIVRQQRADWEAHRNAAQATVNWRFTTAKARRQLKGLYPA